MITPRNFRSGTVVNIDGKLHVVLQSQHIKPGKGGAFVRAKLKNLDSGSIREMTLRPDEKYEEAYIDEKKMQFLYRNGDSYHFMDTNTYDQISLDKAFLGDAVNFLKENIDVRVEIYKGQIIGIDLPTFVVLKVEHTEPGFKGDTSRSGMKPATLETGARVQVPLFVNTGDLIKVDTRTGEYAERA